MAFKKLHPHILETLEDLAIVEPTALQSKSIPVIKSGAHVFCTGPKDSGKTTTLVLTTLQKLGCTSEGNAPRAVVLVENKAKALEAYDAFQKFTKYSELRVYASYEELHIDVQKSEIYMGVDILISTPKTFHRLLLSNGVSISDLKLCSVDDADFLSQNSAYTQLLTTSQSIKKCQYVLYSEKLTPKLKGLEAYFMERAKHIKG